MDDSPACTDHDPELFFPERTPGRPRRPTAYDLQLSAAKAVCADCPIRAQCLLDNLDMPFGIWGGLDRPERAGLMRAQGRVSGGHVAWRNMSTLRDHQILGARAEQEAIATGDQRRLTHIQFARRRRDRVRAERAAQPA